MGRRLHGLDALRGIAAMMVLVYHLSNEYALGWPFRGYLAVDFFFMLSGFIMVRVYEPRLRGGWSTFRFLAARVRRLWPMMALGWAIGLPAYLASDPYPSWWAIAAGLLLIPVAAKFVYPVNPPTWSIFFELFANAVHGTLLAKVRTRFIVALIVACVPVVVANALALGALGGGPNSDGFALAFPRVLLEYGVGMVLARSVVAIRPKPWAFWVTGAFLPLFPLIGNGGALADLLFVLVICPLALVGGLCVEKVPTALGLLGAASFPIYAVHYPIIVAAKGAGMSPLAAGFSAVVAGLFLASTPMLLKLARSFVLHLSDAVDANDPRRDVT